jgi:YVTN family beta-propeller protein
MNRIFTMVVIATMATAGLQAAEPPDSAHWVCVSNERSGDISVFEGQSGRLVRTIPVGKRPRGIHASADGRTLYVAVSGSPIMGPPKLDAAGAPVFPKVDEGDRAQDGIAIVDLKSGKVVKKLMTGTDPEEFAVSTDGKRLYVSNEDAATATVLSATDGKIEAVLNVKEEPEGVAISPDGKHVYVTCETKGEVFVFDTKTHRRVAQIAVGGRPRTVAFLPDGSLAFIPSETTGTVSVIDTRDHTVARSIKLPTGSRPMGTIVSPDGKTLFVSTGRGGTVCVIDLPSAAVKHVVKAGDRPWGVAIVPAPK